MSNLKCRIEKLENQVVSCHKKNMLDLFNEGAETEANKYEKEISEKLEQFHKWYGENKSH